LTKPIILSPSLLAADFGGFASAAKALVEAGAESLHFDIMDGHFVPNLTFGPQVVRDLRPVTGAFYDVHLMVERTEMYVDELGKAGAGMLTVHPESTAHLDRLVGHVKETGMRVGVALNPATPIEQCEWVLAEVDRVLVMTVNPGYGGQSFIPAMIGKIEKLAALRDERGLSFEIGVDGGIGAQTAPSVVRAGANVLIAGSAVFRHPSGVAAGLDELRKSAAGA
jgi:ribulose-phosphate 3-epimerase